MTLDQYHDLWASDCVLHTDRLDDDAQQVPYLHAKWWRFYTTERLRYRKLDTEYKVLFRQKWEWYTGKLDDAERIALKWPPQPLRILVANVNIYMDADPDVQEHTKARIMSEETLKFLEDVIKAINKRGYDIKNAIDFMKFKMGV